MVYMWMRDAERLGVRNWRINPLNPKLNPICYLLALLAHHFLHVSRIRDKSLTLRLLMSYIYIYIYIYIYMTLVT
jgi:transposase